MTPPRRQHRLRSDVDPQAAFQARLRRDHRDLIRLSAQVRHTAPWRHVAAPLVAMEGLAHGLAGASGVFGFAALGEEAARLERLLERWRLRPPAEISRQRMVAFVRALAPLLDGLFAASWRSGGRRAAPE